MIGKTRWMYSRWRQLSEFHVGSCLWLKLLCPTLAQRWALESPPSSLLPLLFCVLGCLVAGLKKQPLPLFQGNKSSWNPSRNSKFKRNCGVWIAAKKAIRTLRHHNKQTSIMNIVRLIRSITIVALFQSTRTWTTVLLLLYVTKRDDLLALLELGCNPET